LCFFGIGMQFTYRYIRFCMCINVVNKMKIGYVLLGLFGLCCVTGYSVRLRTTFDVPTIKFMLLPVPGRSKHTYVIANSHIALDVVTQLLWLLFPAHKRRGTGVSIGEVFVSYDVCKKYTNSLYSMKMTILVM